MWWKTHLAFSMTLTGRCLSFVTDPDISSVCDPIIFINTLKASSAQGRPGKNSLLAVCYFLLYFAYLFLDDDSCWVGTYMGEGNSTLFLEKKYWTKVPKNRVILANLACPLSVPLRKTVINSMTKVEDCPSVGSYSSLYLQGGCTKNFVPIGIH